MFTHWLTRTARRALTFAPLALTPEPTPRRASRAPASARKTPEDASLRTFFDLTHDPLLVLDQQYVIQDANQAAITFFGRPLDQLRGTPALEVDVLARMLTAGSILQRLKSDPPPVSDEVSVTDSEGQPLQARIEAIPYDHGERTLLHFQNTTAVLRTRAALRSAEQLHQAMLEALPAVAWTMALPEERLVEVSPAVERMFGYQPAAFRSDRELWTELVHPADRERVRAEFRRGVASGRSFEIEFTGMHRDHEDLPHLVNRVIPVADERGWVDRCEGFIEDRSAERMLQATLSTTEGHLRHTLESVSSGILVLRPGEDGVRVELCNRRLAMLLRLDEPLRPGTLLAEAPEDVRRLVAEDDRPSSFERGVMLEDTSDEIVELDEPRRVLRRYSAPVHDPLGSVAGRIITIEDVTSSWLMRRRLTHAQKMESMSRLAGGVAHDFNNLLGAVSGFAHMAMEQTAKDDSRFEALNQIVQHTHRATRLTQALLSFSRSARFERMPVDLNRVIDDSYQLARSAIDPAVSIQYDLDHSLPPVMGDAVLLQQLVVNLVQEAGAVLGSGQVLRVATRTEDRPTLPAPDAHGSDVAPAEGDPVTGRGARRVVLEVHASGTRSRDDEHAGSSFGSAVASSDEAEGEIGLAMTIAEDIARVHGGYLLSGAAAAPSIYRVGIPVSVSEEAPLLAPDESMARGHETVLVVDDEPALLTVAKAGLQQRGFQVVTAENGEQGLEILRGGKTHVDLLVLDLSMPGLSGDRVLRTLRGFAPDLPVVIASGYATVESQKAWTAAGAQGFVAKPYRIRDLASKLREVLDRTHGRVP